MNQNEKTTFEALIYTIRGQRVMLDYDLAMLYGVDNKVLKRAVRRHLERFPSDFMFQLTDIESEFSRCQIGALKKGSGSNIKYAPYAFTGHGIAMLSSVLNSHEAIQVHISIIRSFFKMRDLLREEKNWDSQLKALEKNTGDLFQLVFERLTRVERDTPLLSPKRRKIGI
jgi:hypothetical protein